MDNQQFNCPFTLNLIFKTFQTTPDKIIAKNMSQ